ncbi:MAG: methyl-accepting chemotaxis protein [Deferribacteraceae bacterium]|jgi:methyl-accepting chemotaxis protein|nr:methyl-accepting chemotaxis protein [Deferribacteraceae bacterium]
MKLSLQKKLLLISIVPLLLILVGILVMTQYVLKNNAVRDAINFSNEVAKTNALAVSNTVTEMLSTSFNISEDVSILAQSGANRELLYAVFTDYIKRYKFFGGGVVMQPDAVGLDADYANTTYHTETGQFYPYIGRDGDNYIENVLNFYANELWYDKTMINGAQTVTEPFILDIASNSVVDSATAEEFASGARVPVITMASPIKLNGQVVGASIIDLEISLFEQVFDDSVKVFGTGEALLISGDGSVIFSTNKDDIAKTLEATHSTLFDAAGVVSAIQANESKAFAWEDENGEAVESLVLPIKISGTDSTWGLLITFVVADSYKAMGLTRLQIILWSMFGVIVLLVLIIMLYLRRAVIRRIDIVLHILQHVAEGDLAIRVSMRTGDEFETLGENVNLALRSIREAFAEVKNQVGESMNAANELVGATQELQESFHAQNAETDSVAAAVEELSSSARGVSEITKSSAEAATDTNAKIIDGREALSSALSAMNIITNKTASLAKTVEDLGVSSEKIGEILNVINDIADQTNLLALNAAIEAARAGEAGRGFAVVADEVRKLAERTSKSTKEIKDIVVSLQNDTTKATEEMSQAGESVSEGVEKTRTVEEIFEQIVAAVSQIEEGASSVSIAVEEQANALHGVSENIRAISTTVEQSVGTVANFGNITGSLESAASKTQSLIDKFHL